MVAAKDPRPVFILGVPRSGTTLLRTLLDSHPGIACGPESPWIAGSYGDLTSFKDLYQSLATDKRGPVRNLTGVQEQDVALALGKAINEIFTAHARARGKELWVEKTPNHALDIPLLHAMFPRAKYLHLVRDGRDVACSTYNGRKQWGMLPDVDGPMEITRLNALERWARWEKLIADCGAEYSFTMHGLRYEDLIAEPERELRAILEFLGQEYHPGMLDYAASAHDYPGWEAGSADVRHKGGLDPSSLHRWKTEYPEEELSAASDLVRQTLRRHGYVCAPENDPEGEGP